MVGVNLPANLRGKKIKHKTKYQRQHKYVGTSEELVLYVLQRRTCGETAHACQFVLG